MLKYNLIHNCKRIFKIGYSGVSIEKTKERYLTYTGAGFVKYYKIDQTKVTNYGSDFAIEQKQFHHLSEYKRDDTIVDQDLLAETRNLDMTPIARTRDSYKSEWFQQERGYTYL